MHVIFANCITDLLFVQQGNECRVCAQLGRLAFLIPQQAVSDAEFWPNDAYLPYQGHAVGFTPP